MQGTLQARVKKPLCSCILLLGFLSCVLLSVPGLQRKAPDWIKCNIHFKRDIWTGQKKGLQGLNPYQISKKSHILEVRKHRGLMRVANCQAELNLAKEIEIKTRQVFSWRMNRREGTWRSKIWHRDWINALSWDAVLWDRVRRLKRLLVSASKQRLCCAFPSPHHSDEASPHVLRQLLNPLVNHPRKACG